MIDEDADYTPTEPTSDVFAMVDPEQPDDYTPDPPEWASNVVPLRRAPPDPHREHLRLGTHFELRDKTLALLEQVGPVIHNEGSFLRYQDGTFSVLTEADVYEDVAARDGAPVTDETGKTKPLRLRHSDAMAVISSMRMKTERKGYFDRTTPGCAFANGFASVKVSGVQLVPHSIKHKARHKYDFDYEVAAAPLGWLKFLQEVWHDEPDINDRIDCLRQFMGLCLCGLATRYQAALVLFGEGSNGKSVISEILKDAMPAGSSCSVSPQEMSNDYSRAMLSGKLLNVVSELPEQDILNNEAWKAVISGDLIKAREIRQAPFTFKPTAGHLYSANRLPGTQDHTHGFWRRMVVLTFNRSFEGAERDTGLAKRLIKAERQAIVNWAIEGVTTVISSGALTVPESSAVAVASWRKDSDQVASFIEECTTRIESDDIGTDRMVVYREYRNWSDRNGHRPVAMNKFGQRLRSLNIHTERQLVGGQRARRYLLRLIEPD